MELSTIILLIIVTIAITFPVLVIKKYVKTNNIFYLILAVFLYIVVIIGYIHVLRKYPMHYLYPIWFISMIIALFSGALFFDEKIKPINVFGVFLGLVAIYFVMKQ